MISGINLGLPKEPATIAIVDAQWGDTGKGKFVDLFAGWADIIARGTGGANAGHTICVKDKTLILNLIPSGILQDKDGKTNIIGNGVALDPRVLVNELDLLEREGITTKHLRIAANAHLVLPQHLVMDHVKEARAGNGKIGTTGRGIGPVYTDRVARMGLLVSDLLNTDIFVAKLRRNLEDKVDYLRTAHPELVQSVMEHPHLNEGNYYDRDSIFNVDAIVAAYEGYLKRFRCMVSDTDRYLREAAGKQKILLEGAQGILLSVNHGFHPHVTSSDSSLAGLAKGVGLMEHQVDRTYAIAKAFYMTRVGEGVFPTELGGNASAQWCSKSGMTRETEPNQHSRATVNSSNSFLQGVGIRIAGGEYGATTGRPRRVGWLDIPLLRYALQFAGKDIRLVLTKLDVLDECREIKLCVDYKYVGPPREIAEGTLQSNGNLIEVIPQTEILEQVEPLLEPFPGWLTKTSDLRSSDQLPPELLDLIHYVRRNTGVPVELVSVGPGRHQTLLLTPFEQ